MINKTAAELDRLLLTANEEYQTLKDEEKDVVICGKSLARIYDQLIDVIEQLRMERQCNTALRRGLHFYYHATQEDLRIHQGDRAFDALQEELDIREAAIPSEKR